MLFEPAHKYEIIKESQYAQGMNEITKIMEDHVQRGYFESFDNARMYYEFFRVASPKASIVIIHGYTEFSKKYYELSWYFMNMGYNVFLYDVRGHGNSHRYGDDLHLTHVESYEDYAKDLDCYIKKIVEPMGDGAPLYIYSHSMGGSIAGLYLSAFKSNVDKAILSSPMVYPVTPPLPRFVLKLLMKHEAKKHGWDARFRFSSDFNPNARFEESNDKSEGRFKYNLALRVENKNYQNSCGTNRWNYEAICVKEKLLSKKRMRGIEAELFVISAQKDNTVRVRPQRKLARILGCAYVVFENARHCLFTTGDEDLKKYVDTLSKFFGDK